MISYKKNFATSTQIAKHLKNCHFFPPLENYTNIPIYSRKIVKFAQRFEIWDNNLLIGLAAVYYYNGTENLRGYITNLSILPNYTNHGFASKLLKKYSSMLKKNNFKTIDLELFSINQPALNLYTKNNFKIKKIIHNKISMSKIL